MLRISRLVRPDTHALSWKAAVLPAALMLACVTYAAPVLKDELVNAVSTQSAPVVPDMPSVPPVPAAPPAVMAPPVPPVTVQPPAPPQPASKASAARVAIPAASAETAVAPKAVLLAQAAVPSIPAVPPVPATEAGGSQRNPAAPADVGAVSTIVTPGRDVVQSGWTGRGPVMTNPKGRSDCVVEMPPEQIKSLAKDLPEGASTVLNFLVGTDGKIKTASIAHSSGSAALDEIARLHHGSCRYQPGTVDGEPAEMFTMLTQTWKKSGTELEIRPGASMRGAAIVPGTCKKPNYPALALEKGLTGTVSMNFRVGVDGKVKDAIIKRSSGTRELDVTALDALRLCTFKPATSNDEAVESWTNLQYVWQLSAGS